MFTYAKYILTCLMIAGSIQTSFLQPASQHIPSLINNKTSGNQNDDTGIEALLKQKMLVRVFTNKNKVFIGEPLMATYKFYVASSINDRPSVTKQPEFSGCSVKELNFDQGPEFEDINNEAYSVYTIRRVQLTPLQEGSLWLGRAYVNNYVQVFNPDNAFTTRKYNITVSNSDEAVDVINLPENNKPKDFYGITGTFSIAASAENDTIPVGENGNLIVTIKGAGNLDAIVQPEIEWPQNIQHFDGKDSQHVSQNDFPVTGDRIFNIPFIGSREANIIIPPIKFSYFNTASKKYETVQTDSIPVSFTKALTKKGATGEIVNYDISNRKYLWIVPAIAFIVALAGLISYKRSKHYKPRADTAVNATIPPASETTKPAYTIIYRTDFSRHFEELQAITNNKAFFEKAKNILTKAVAEKLDSTQYSEQVLMKELIQKTGDAPVCNKAAALYETINLHLYAPFETTADLDFCFKEIKNVVDELRRQS
ncbi:BatD family protein [Parafilimonas sp.]|uniref:BatD family protein n=1 Tax=Parafilimonas sp. TaxID=1969739 RepID=UPI0039E461F3